MKKKSTILILAAVGMISISSFTIIRGKIMSSNGTKTAYTNSPHDGAGDCTSCHNGGSATPVISLTATPAFGPGNTYVPGTVYTLSYKVTGYPKFGFDIELNDGNLTTSMGAGTNVALTNCFVTPNPYSAGYPANVSHTAPILSSSSATWHWTAPANGTVYIYSVGVGVNGNGSDTGDKMAQYNLVLTPSSSTGITATTKDQFQLNCYPNPVNDELTIHYTLTKSSEVSISIMDISGKEISTVKNELEIPGEQTVKTDVNSLAKGIYFISLSVDVQRSVKRFVKQ